MKTKLMTIAAAILLIVSAAPIVAATDTSATVTNDVPSVESVSLDASSTPTAGSTTTVALTITVSDGNGYQDIDIVSYTVYKADGTTEHIGSASAASNDDGSGTTQTYGASFQMQFYDDPALGNDTYKVRATAIDLEGAVSSTTDGTFNYQDLAALSLSDSSVSFGSLAPGARSSTSTLTVTNHGNVQIDIATNGTEMSNGAGQAIAGSNLKYDLLATDMLNEIDLTGTPFTNTGFDLAKGPDSSAATYWQVAVPSGSDQYIPADIYTGTLTVSAIAG